MLRRSFVLKIIEAFLIIPHQTLFKHLTQVKQKRVESESACRPGLSQVLTKSEILDFMMTYPIQAAQTVLMEDDYPQRFFRI